MGFLKNYFYIFNLDDGNPVKSQEQFSNIEKSHFPQWKCVAGLSLGSVTSCSCQSEELWSLKITVHASISRLVSEVDRDRTDCTVPECQSRCGLSLVQHLHVTFVLQVFHSLSSDDLSNVCRFQILPNSVKFKFFLPLLVDSSHPFVCFVYFLITFPFLRNPLFIPSLSPRPSVQILPETLSECAV